MSKSITPLKEACAILEATRKWSQFLKGRHFTLITDQRSVAFMLDQQNRGKIKNAKLLAWRLEFSQLTYTMCHRPGREHVAPDAISRICSTMPSTANIRSLREQLGHPGFSRLYHFVRSRNLPYTSDETKNAINNCRTCAEENLGFSNLLRAPSLKRHARGSVCRFISRDTSGGLNHIFSLQSMNTAGSHLCLRARQ